MMRPPFSWLGHQEPLPWFGVHIDGSFILQHAHGPNMPSHDETSHRPTSTLSFLFILWVPFLLLGIFLLLSWESLGEASQRFHFGF
jgi:hypothetical protein